MGLLEEVIYELLNAKKEEVKEIIKKWANDNFFPEPTAFEMKKNIEVENLLPMTGDGKSFAERVDKAALRKRYIELKANMNEKDAVNEIAIDNNIGHKTIRSILISMELIKASKRKKTGTIGEAVEKNIVDFFKTNTAVDTAIKFGITKGRVYSTQQKWVEKGYVKKKEGGKKPKDSNDSTSPTGEQT